MEKSLKKAIFFKKKKWEKTFIQLKLLAVFLLSVFHLSAKATTQNALVSVKIHQASLVDFFSAISSQTNYEFLYNHDLVSNKKPVSLKVKRKDLKTLLNDVLHQRKLSYQLDDHVIIISERETEIPPPDNKKYSIRGKVVDEKGNALPGVTVAVKNGDKLLFGTVTDPTGIFRLEIDKRANTLEVSMMGFETQNIPIGKQSTYLVRLKPDVKEIEEVVITGIFNKPKESFTGAATLITKEELESFGGRNLLQTISNIDPSIHLRENNEFGSDPNKLPEIEIRGISSLPSIDTETKKIDAESALSTPLIILDGFEISLERMMDLEEDEIHNITILKDAGATAIYGSRGANGVIVIMRTVPKSGRLQVNYSYRNNMEIPDLSSYNVLNATEKLQLEKDAGLYKEKTGEANFQLLLDHVYNLKLKEVVRGVDTDWLSQPLRIGMGQHHTLSLGGGDKTFRYNINIGYKSNVGVMKGSKRDNLNGSISLMYLHKKWRINNQVSIGLNNANQTTYGSFSKYVDLNPYWTPYDEHGNLKKFLEQYSYAPYKSNESNPLYNASLDMIDKTDYLNVMNNLSVEVEPIKGLKLSGHLGVSKQINNGDYYVPATHTLFDTYSGANVFKKGLYRYSTGKSHSYNAGFKVNFNKAFAEKHLVTFGFYTDLSESQSQNYNVETEGYIHEQLTFFGSGLAYKTDGKPYGSEAKSRRIGFTGNLNYTYDNKYYVDGSYRSDGSSMFGEDTRFAPFWSVGAGWNLYKESFIEDLNTFSNLRLKVSYGVTGTQNFPEYQSYTTYIYNTSESFGPFIGASMMGIGNPNLKWQETKQINLGLEMGFFNNRIAFNANVYRKRTSNLISALELPMSSGFSNYQANKGSLKNEGIELRATLALIRNSAKRMNLNLTASMASNKNTITSISEELKRYNQLLEEAQNTDPQLMYREGSSMRTLWAVESRGIDPSSGKEILVKKDGRLTYDWEASDKTDCGIIDAPYRGNINIMFRYRDFSMNMSLMYHFGAQKYNSTLVRRVENANLKYNVDRRVYEDRWKKPGDDVFFKGLTETDATRVSSRFVQNDNLLQANNINISYNFRNKWLEKHTGMKNLKLSAGVIDIFRISTIKAERGTNYPFSRRVSFSASARF